MDQLRDELIWIHIEWALYRSLFGKDRQRIEELNKRTGHVTRIFQDALLDRVLLAIARLFDTQKKTVTFRNALRTLECSGSDREMLGTELESLAGEARSIVMQRHRRIAHTDRVAALNESVLPGISRRLVTEVLSAAEGFYNRMSLIRDESTQPFDVPIDRDQEREADLFLRVIREGNASLDAEWEAKRAAWKRDYGEHSEPPDEDDIAPWRGP